MMASRNLPVDLILLKWKPDLYMGVWNNMKYSVPAVEADGGDLSQFISTASMLIPTSQSKRTRAIWKIMSPRPLPLVLIIIILDSSAG